MRECSLFVKTVAVTCFFNVAICVARADGAIVLEADSFRHYVDTFNKSDEELYVQHIPNEGRGSFSRPTSLRSNVPMTLSSGLTISAGGPIANISNVLLLVAQKINRS